MISRCQLKPANKKFTNINNDYEMTFTHDTQVVECVDEDNSIPKITFNFVPLQKLADTPVDTIVGKFCQGKALGQDYELWKKEDSN